MTSKRAASSTAISGNAAGNKKKKTYTGAYVPRANELQPGMRGCLITCDVHVEREAIKEAFRLLEDLHEAQQELDAANLSSAAKAAPDAADASAGAPAVAGAAALQCRASSSSMSAGDALQAELQALQEESSEKQQGGKDGNTDPTKPFSVAQTGCGGNVFIRFSRAVTLSPTAIVDKIFERAKEGNGIGSRAPHVIRMVPITLTCPSSHDIGAAVTPLTDAPAAEGGLMGFAGTYRVEWRRRCNSDINKEKVIDAVATAIAKAAPTARVDLKQAECAVMAEVIKTTCCLSVLPRWKEFCGYNLRACTGGVPTEHVPSRKSDHL